MNSDGVSLPTTISQLGSVAKSQARAQQTGQNAVPFQKQLDKQEELKVQRVQQAEKSGHRRVEADDERPDKRKRRRRRREQKLLEREQAEAAAAGADGRDRDDDEERDRVGGLIDLRA